jgi:transposase-like protein
MSTPNLMSVIKSFKTELEAIVYFMQQRWNGKITCPYKDCQSNEFNDTNNKIYTLKSGYNFRCSCCKKTFSYKTGTIFENSKIELRQWFTAIYLHTANKKGISSCQLAKHIGITQKTAWFMLHRIRFAITGESDNNNEMFSGETEADELYLGGKEGNKHTKDKFKTTKNAMLGIVNRDTKKAIIKQVKSTEYHILGKEIMNKVETGSTLITDSYASYKTLGKFYNHETVNHSANEYVKISKAIDNKSLSKFIQILLKGCLVMFVEL